jgi:hypothetical protein
VANDLACLQHCPLYIYICSYGETLPESGPLPSAFYRTLGKVLRSVKSLFTECRTLGTAKDSSKTALPSVKHSAKMALGKGPLAAVYSWRPSVFAEGQKPACGKVFSLPSVKYLALGKESLYRVSSVDTRQSIFLFFLFWPPNFLWYVPTLCRPTCTIGTIITVFSIASRFSSFIWISLENSDLNCRSLET